MTKKKAKNSQNIENQESVNKRPRIQVQFDIDYEPHAKNPKGKSQTVPDLNLTVRQLLHNHSRGLSNEKDMKQPLYFDVKIPKITDITDVEEYRENLNNKIQEVDAFIKQEEENRQLDLEEEIKKAEAEKETAAAKKLSEGKI